MIHIKFLLPILTAAALIASCNSNPAATEKRIEESVAEQDAGNLIRLTAAQIKQAQIETGGFVKRPLSELLPAAAELHVDKEHTATVSAFTNGIISDLRITQNKELRKGAVVAALQKHDLVDMQQAFLENRNKMVFLQAEYERYKLLKDADATALKNYQKAEAELRTAQTSDKAMAARLQRFQIDPEKLNADKIQTEILIHAPISGTVTRISAGLGSALQTGDVVCEISDFTQLHPVIYVFEKDIAKVKAGQKVTLNFPADPENTLQATIFTVERMVDPERKAIRVHARFDRKPGSNLVSGTYLDAQIVLQSSGSVNALPEDAVIREESGNYIFALMEQNDQGAIFKKIPVLTGATDGIYMAIRPKEALTPNAKIVTKGAYYVSAQSAGLEVEE
jgi:cobalt-zinc-cadmium efflux system membrane fusion protein